MGCGRSGVEVVHATQPEVESAPPPDIICVSPSHHAPHIVRRSSSLWSTGSETGGLPNPSLAEILCAQVHQDPDVFERAIHDVCVFGTTEPISNEYCSQGPGKHYRGEGWYPAVVEVDFSEKAASVSLGTGSEGGIPGQVDQVRQMLLEYGGAFACRKGRKKEMSNQDSYFMCSAGNLIIGGIADGHGDCGHWVSHWVSRFVMAQCLADLCVTGSMPDQIALQRIFNVTHEACEQRAKIDGFDIVHSGSTLTLLVLDREARDLSVSWVGDSKCVLANARGDSVRVLTEDHKPDSLEERRRIITQGGEVRNMGGSARVRLPASPSRTYDPELVEGLAMSRSIGDTALHMVGVMHEPGSKRILLEAEDEVGGPHDQFIMCCSDGVWDFVPAEDAAEVVRKHGPSNAIAAAEELVKVARQRWDNKVDVSDGIDDISAVIIWL